MKIKLALAILGILAICFLPGCRDLTMEEYQEARAERAEAQAKVAELQAQLEAEQATLAETQEELEASQAEIAELETELETYKAKVDELETELERLRAGPYLIEEDSSSESTPLQEKDLKYIGYEGRFGQFTSVNAAIIDASWDNDKLTVTWELTNTTNRKIHLDLLAVKARDQMWLKGEWEVEDEDDEIVTSEEPIPVYPTLQDDIETPWPGEIVRITTEWQFGPLSEKITIEFVVLDEEGEVLEDEDNILPPFTLMR